MAASTLTPEFTWAQDNEILYIGITAGVDNAKIELTSTTFKFTGEEKGKQYALEFNFAKPINVEKSKWATHRIVECVIAKENQDEEYWNHLLTPEDKKKLKNWCKVDFDKWRDEDDSGDEGLNIDQQGMQGMGGMPGMGGMGGMPGMGGMGGMPGMGGMGGMPGMGGGAGGMDMAAMMQQMQGMGGMGGAGGAPGADGGMGGMDMEKLMAMMGKDGAGGMPGMGDLPGGAGGDSDDDDLPDLEDEAGAEDVSNVD